MNKSSNKGRFCTKAGFTLIELLVVVLIIGILAAVALPQYQKVIAKNRIMSEFLVGKKIMEAHQIYYLENSIYTKDVQKLGLEGLCTPVNGYSYICTTKNANVFVSGNSVLMEIYKPRVNLDFAKTGVDCQVNESDLNALAHQACRAFTGKSTYDRIKDWQNPPGYVYSMSF